MAFQINMNYTKRNRDGVSPVFSARIIIRRQAAPFRQRDYVGLFGKWPLYLWEIFWEGIEHMLEETAHFILYAIDKNFLAERASKYVEAI